MPLYAVRRLVRFQDIDAAGVVFFARVLEYFHDAYVDCLASRGIALTKALAERTWGTPVAHAEADFQAPLRFGDEIEVIVEEAKLSESSLRLSYLIRGVGEPRRVHCSGAMVHVCIDLANFRPRPLPVELRAALTPQTDEAAG